MKNWIKRLINIHISPIGMFWFLAFEMFLLRTVWQANGRQMNNFEILVGVIFSIILYIIYRLFVEGANEKKNNNKKDDDKDA